MPEDFKFNIDELVDKKNIAAAIKEKLQVEISNTIGWQVQDLVKKHALEVLNEDIKSIIEEQKDQILQGIKEGLPGIAKALSEQMVANAVKNLNGYGGREIFKKLFD